MTMNRSQVLLHRKPSLFRRLAQGSGGLWLSSLPAANIFRVSILISGKEPSWSEVYKMMREK